MVGAVCFRTAIASYETKSGLRERSVNFPHSPEFVGLIRRLRVPVHRPAEVFGGGFIDGARRRWRSWRRRGARSRSRRCSAAASACCGISTTPAPPKVLSGSSVKRALADVAGDLAGEVVGGEAREAHGAGLDRAVERAVRVFLADGARDDELVVHLHAFAEEVLGQVGAVEADGLVGVVAVVVVPVEQGGGRLAGEREGVHGERAEDVDLAGGGDEVARSSST